MVAVIVEPETVQKTRASGNVESMLRRGSSGGK